MIDKKRLSEAVNKLADNMLRSIQAQEDYIKSISDDLTEEQDIILRLYANDCALILMGFNHKIDELYCAHN